MVVVLQTANSSSAAVTRRSTDEMLEWIHSPVLSACAFEANGIVYDAMTLCEDAASRGSYFALSEAAEHPTSIIIIATGYLCVRRVQITLSPQGHQQRFSEVVRVM